jgi:hypothetical protein
MRLSDIMSNMNLASYPQIALIIFLVVFACIAIYVWRVPRQLMQERSRLPLDED